MTCKMKDHCLSKEENSKALKKRGTPHTMSEECTSHQTLTKPPENNLNRFSGKETTNDKFQAVSANDSDDIQEHPFTPSGLEEHLMALGKLENGPTEEKKERGEPHTTSEDSTSRETSTSPPGCDLGPNEFNTKKTTRSKFQAVPHVENGHKQEDLTTYTDIILHNPSGLETVDLQVEKRQCKKHEETKLQAQDNKKASQMHLSGSEAQDSQNNFMTRYRQKSASRTLIPKKACRKDPGISRDNEAKTDCREVPKFRSKKVKGPIRKSFNSSKRGKSNSNKKLKVRAENGQGVQPKKKSKRKTLRSRFAVRPFLRARVSGNSTIWLLMLLLLQCPSILAGDIVGLAFQVQPEETAVQGQPHNLTCLVGGLPAVDKPLPFVWYKDGKMLPPVGQVLMIPSSKQENSGYYQCGVPVHVENNPVDFLLSKSFHLFVEDEGHARNNQDFRGKTPQGNATVPGYVFAGDIVGLAFQVQPEETAVQGQPHNLTCLVGGLPAVDKLLPFVWYKDGKMLPPVGQVLMIPSSKQENSGYYQCGVPVHVENNPVDFLLSKSFHLFVEDEGHARNNQDFRGKTPQGNATVPGYVCEDPVKGWTSRSGFLYIGLPVIGVVALVFGVFVLCKRDHLKRKCCSKEEQSRAEEGIAMNTLKTDHAIQSSGEVADQNACTKLMQANGH